MYVPTTRCSEFASLIIITLLHTTKKTDPNSLLFSGLILSRLTYALCLNFLSVIHLDSHITGVLDLEDTAFTSIMGHMDVLSFVANGFNIYYPMSIVLVCMATYFSLGSRCMNCLGFQAFVVEDDVSVDYIAEGKDLVRRGKFHKHNLQIKQFKLLDK